ncbi:MAG: NFACT family protein, partial [Clostridiales bacterium]|nr:NFACT family protein [Clostridiales bacterium]
KLTVNVNAYDCCVYFTEAEKENPLVAPNFCMLLRKHLQGAEILSVETIGFERILSFRVRCLSDFSSCERTLNVEIMGKYSNAILIENGTILGAMKMTTLDESHKRFILSGVKYTLPAPQDKVNPSDFSALSALLKEPPADLAHTLFTAVSGLAPCTAEQIAASYRGGDLPKYVHEYIFSDKVSPCVLEREGVPVDFYARQITGAIPFSTLSEAQSYFYQKRRAKKGLEGKRRALASAVSSALKKHQKRLAQTVEKRQSCLGAEENRIKGELLTANLYAIQRGANACELYNYYDENGGMLKITLDPRLTPSENAQSYYKKYRKQKRTLEVLAPQEAETLSEIEYLKSLSALIETAETGEDLRSVEEELTAAELIKVQKTRTKKAPPEIPYRTFECGGFKILAGRNNLQNDRLVRASSGDDLWLHAQKYHSSHVVIKSDGKPVPDDVLLYAARVCAKYSDGNKGGSISVDYTKVKNVKKPPKSKAGFVIYTDYKTLLVTPLDD